MLASFGKKEDNIQTPEDLYTELDSEFHFTFDPCPLNPKFDGLKVNWEKVHMSILHILILNHG